MSVLIVGDDDQVRGLVAGVLSETYECVAVATAEEALALLARRPFRVVLADVNLPGLGGLGLVKRMYSLHPGVRIVVMSGDPLDGADRWSSYGVRAYLMKPLDLAELERVVGAAAEPPSE